MLGVTFNQFVDFFSAVRSHTKQVFCKTARLRIHRTALLPENPAHVIGALASHVSLKQHLQNQFTRFAAGGPGGGGNGQWLVASFLYLRLLTPLRLLRFVRRFLATPRP